MNRTTRVRIAVASIGMATVASTTMPAAPAAAAPRPFPQGVSGWLTAGASTSAPWDGMYVKRRGSRITVAGVAGLEGGCLTGTLDGNTGRFVDNSYGTTIRSANRYYRDGRALRVDFKVRGQLTRMLYVRRSPARLKRLLGKGRDVNMSAKRLFSFC